MQIIGAAALIALGIVVAAILYGRSHGRMPTPQPADREATAALNTVLAERSTGLDRREESLIRREEALDTRETDLDRQREELSQRRGEVEQRLESVAGLSGARAKQLLLEEVEDQAKHESARRIRQIEEETKREAERREIGRAHV